MLRRPVESTTQYLPRLAVPGAAVKGPGCVKKASYRRRAQNTAGIRALRRNFSRNPLSERPETLPGASAGIDLNAQHPPAQVARASSSPVTPMIAMTRLML